MGSGTRTPTRVTEFMSSPVETVEPSASLVDAAGLMDGAGISAVVVTADPLAIVTSTDLVRAVAEGHDTSELGVTDVATEVVQTAAPDDFLQQAASVMLRNDVSHLPVLEDGDLVGMISTTDITESRSN